MYPNNGNYYGQPQQQQTGWILGDMNTNTNINYPNIDNNAYISPSPQVQVQGQGFSSGQGFNNQPGFNQGFNNQPYGQGF